MSQLGLKKIILDRDALVIEVTASTVILILGSVSLYLNGILTAAGQATLHQTLNEYARQSIRGITDNPFGDQAAVIGFWAIFGVFIYMVYLWLHNLFVHIHNRSVINETFTKGQQTTLGEKSQLYIARGIRFISKLLLLIVIYSFIALIMPFCLELGVFFIGQWNTADGWIAACSSIILLTISIHLVYLLQKLAFSYYTEI